MRERFRAGSLRFALIFPPDAESDKSFGLKMKFLQNPTNEIETQTVTGLVRENDLHFRSASLARIAPEKGDPVHRSGKSGPL